MGLSLGGSSKSKSNAYINTDSLINFTPSTQITANLGTEQKEPVNKPKLTEPAVLSLFLPTTQKMSLASGNSEIASMSDYPNTNETFLIIGLVVLVGWFFYGN